MFLYLYFIYVSFCCCKTICFSLHLFCYGNSQGFVLMCDYLTCMGCETIVMITNARESYNQHIVMNVCHQEGQWDLFGI